MINKILFREDLILDTIKEERRIFNRVECRKPVGFRLKDPSIFGGCLSSDISEGGIKVNLNEFVPLDTEFILEVKIATQEIVDCVARVVWIEKLAFMDRYQAGLEFKNERIDLGSKKKIHMLMQASNK